MAPSLLRRGRWLAVAYDLLGYGVGGSGLYIDPGRNPLGFLQAVGIRLPVLMFSQWSQAPVDLWMGMPTWLQLGLCGAGWVVSVGLLSLFVPSLRASAVSHPSNARLEKGDELEVIFDPSDPETVELRSDRGRSGPVLIYVLVGVAAFLVGLYFFYSSFQFARDAKRLSKK